MIARVPLVGCGRVGAHVVSLSGVGFVGAALGIQLVHPFLARVEFFAGSGDGLAMRARGVLRRVASAAFASASAAKALAFASVSVATASRLSRCWLRSPISLRSRSASARRRALRTTNATRAMTAIATTATMIQTMALRSMSAPSICPRVTTIDEPANSADARLPTCLNRRWGRGSRSANGYLTISVPFIDGWYVQ